MCDHDARHEAAHRVRILGGKSMCRWMTKEGAGQFGPADPRRAHVRRRLNKRRPNEHRAPSKMTNRKKKIARRCKRGGRDLLFPCSWAWWLESVVLLGREGGCVGRARLGKRLVWMDCICMSLISSVVWTWAHLEVMEGWRGTLPSLCLRQGTLLRTLFPYL